MASSIGSAPVIITAPGGSPVCWPVVSPISVILLCGVPLFWIFIPSR